MTATRLETKTRRTVNVVPAVAAAVLVVAAGVGPAQAYGGSGHLETRLSASSSYPSTAGHAWYDTDHMAGSGHELGVNVWSVRCSPVTG